MYIYLHTQGRGGNRVEKPLQYNLRFINQFIQNEQLNVLSIYLYRLGDLLMCNNLVKYRSSLTKKPCKQTRLKMSHVLWNFNVQVFELTRCILTYSLIASRDAFMHAVKNDVNSPKWRLGVTSVGSLPWRPKFASPLTLLMPDY